MLLQNMKPRLHSQKRHFLATITDQSAAPFHCKFLMETYVWLAFLFLGYEGSAPTAFLAPLIIGVNAQVFDPSIKDNDRKMSHLLTLGCALVIDLIWMIIKDSVDSDLRQYFLLDITRIIK
uniref:HCO3_cotransp domain-containing protein n=1 Tax=Ascaris lumbricoides TaxID=6252 RepID=A0A0M3HTV9_ASCLU